MPKYTEKPWGRFCTIDEGEGYKVKLLVVHPGHRLSLQLHYRRSENWTVLQGTAMITLDDMEWVLKPSDSVFINKGATHRLANDGTVDLVVLEAQHGKYLEEDDILRISDDYGRGIGEKVTDHAAFPPGSLSRKALPVEQISEKEEDKSDTD